MKQTISVDDLNELSEEQKEKLSKLWESKVGDKVAISSKFNTKDHTITLLSIGQMIEILSDHSKFIRIQRYDDCNGNQWNVDGILNRIDNRHYETLEGDDDLVKALWLAVKNIL